MPINYVEGDATLPIGDGNKIITHIVNDIGAWGSGFVIAVSNRWPGIDRLYREWSLEDTFLLGAVQMVEVQDDVRVANMVAQRSIIGPHNPKPLDLDALEDCLITVTEEAVGWDASVHMPRMGCDRAGGTWDEVEAVIGKTLFAAGLDIVVYDWKAE